MKCAWGKLGLFAGGLLFGTAGLKILSSKKEAKKAYTYTTAAALRAKEEVMTVVTAVKKNAGVFLPTPSVLNENRAAEKEAEVIEDTASGRNRRISFSREQFSRSVSYILLGSLHPKGA